MPITIFHKEVALEGIKSSISIGVVDMPVQ
jgi:hypothetical protein